MNTVDNIYVINLDSSPQRWKQIIDQQHIFDIPFTRIKAIDGKKMDPSIAKTQSTVLCSHFCTKTMIAISMSHKLAWSTMLKNGDTNAIIMEDDAVLDPQAPNVIKDALNELTLHDPLWDILYLGSFGFDTLSPSHPWSHFSVLNLTPSFQGKHVYTPTLPLGLHGYIVSRKGAKTLLDVVQKTHFHVDVQIVHHSSQLRLYGTKIKVVQQFLDPVSSTQIASNFPVLFNNMFGHKDKDNMSLAFALSSPVFQLAGIPVTPYLLLGLLICLLIPISFLPVFILSTSAWLIFEIAINYKNWFHVLVYGLSFVAALSLKYLVLPPKS